MLEFSQGGTVIPTANNRILRIDLYELSSLQVGVKSEGEGKGSHWFVRGSVPAGEARGGWGCRARVCDERWGCVASQREAWSLIAPPLVWRCRTSRHSSRSTYIHACLPACMPACMHACMHTYMPACMHTYMPACMHTYMPAGHRCHLLALRSRDLDSAWLARLRTPLLLPSLSC